MIFDSPIRGLKEIDSVPSLLNVEMRNAQDHRIITLGRNRAKGSSLEMPPRTPSGLAKYIRGNRVAEVIDVAIASKLVGADPAPLPDLKTGPAPSTNSYL